MTKPTRGGIIRSINQTFPGLRELVESTIAKEGPKGIPRPIQLKSKKLDMLQSIVTGSSHLFAAQLGVEASEALESLGESRAGQLYHGFITCNEVGRNKLFEDSAPVYVGFPDGKLPLFEAVVLFLLLTALKEDPMQICTRVTLSQVRKWLSDYHAGLAHRLHYVMYRTNSKKTEVDITTVNSPSC